LYADDVVVFVNSIKDHVDMVLQIMKFFGEACSFPGRAFPKLTEEYGRLRLLN
jgi:hypothetical protein